MILNFKEIYASSWNVFKKNWWEYIVFLIIATILSFIPIVGQIIQSFMMFALFYALLKSLRGEQISFKSLFNFKAIFNNTTILLAVILWLLSLLTLFSDNLVLMIILLIISLVIAIILFPIFYVAIDKNLAFVDTIKYAAKLTKGARIDIIILIILNFIIGLIGVMAFIIGSFVAFPIIIISSACVYLALESKNS